MTARFRALSVCLACLMFSACAGEPIQSTGRLSDAALPSIAADAVANRGTIVSSDVFTGVDPALSAVGTVKRALYHSTSGVDGRGTEVSGVFVVPKGRPPAGGWPVISFGHGTTGLTRDCGPSRDPYLLGYSTGLTGMVKGGYAVAMTDYQGLGSRGTHPYLEPRTAAFNMIDAVRALRILFDSTSTTWLSEGGSQGGQAAWAANEYAKDYGAGLDLVGSVAVAPAVDLTEIAELAAAGQLSLDQIALAPLLIAGLHAVYPDLDQSLYLHGEALNQQRLLMGCSERDRGRRQDVMVRLTADDVRPESTAATDDLAAKLRGWALPQRRLSAPILVVNGAKDALISPEWVDAAVSRACNRGAVVKHVVQPESTHTTVTLDDDSSKWVAARFRGEKAPSTCQT